MGDYYYYYNYYNYHHNHHYADADEFNDAGGQQLQFATQTGCRSRKNVVSLSLGIDWAAELNLSQ